MTEMISAAPVIQIISAKGSDTGQKRSHNEDFTALYEPVDPEELDSCGCLYAVADGVGGSYKGEKASKYAVEKVLYAYYHDAQARPAERLARIMRSVGNDLYQYANAYGTERMGTTMVAAVIREGRLLVANVGDSRAYLIRGRQVRQITRDHNQISDLVKFGILSKAEAANSRAKNLLTRSLGGFPDVDVDVFDDIPLLPGDLLLLCSDGLHRYLNDPVLLQLTADGAPDEICQRLIAFANQAGGADNITALVAAILPGQDSVKEIQPESLPAQPPALSQELRKGPFLGVKVPKLFAGGMAAFARLSPRRRLYTAGGLLTALVLVILAAAVLINRDRPGQPDQGVVLSDSIPTLTLAVTPTEQPAPTLTSPPPATAEPTAVVTPEAAASAGECVTKPTIALQITLEKFGAAYNPQATYHYALTCNPEAKSCEGRQEIQPGAHGDIKDFWYVVIPEVKQDICEQNQGIWVTFK